MKRFRITWAIFGVVLGALAGLAALGVRSIEQEHSIQRLVGHSIHQEHSIQHLVGQVEHNRTETLSVICRAVNQGREYDRRHETLTRQQAEAETHKLREAVEGNLDLAPEYRSFARLYLGTIVAIERSTPQVLNLNPYRLPNLDCARLLRRARAAN